MLLIVISNSLFSIPSQTQYFETLMSNSKISTIRLSVLAFYRAGGLGRAGRQPDGADLMV